MRKIFQILLIFACTVSSSQLFAQEKVVIRTDRDKYIAGEKVWFTVNCLADDHAGYNSQVVYVELLNGGNSALVQLKMNTSKGHASSFFAIPDSIATGNYALRAYTQWMRNNSEKLYAYKALSIVNPFVTSRFPKAEQVYSIDTVLCYFEGQSVIQNVENKLIFRSFSKYGTPQAMKGSIVGPGNQSIPFETNSLGIGKIQFLSKETGACRVAFKNEDKEVEVSAFDVVKQGNFIKVETNEEQGIALSVVGQQLTRDLKRAFLHVSTAHGKFLKKEKVVLSQESTFTYNSNELPNEILLAILVTEGGEILDSRYFTTKQKTDQAILININKDEYKNRERVELNLENLAGLKNVSVSVSKQGLTNTVFGFNESYLNANSFEALSQLTSGSINLNDVLICFNTNTQFFNGTKVYLPELKGEILSGVCKDASTLQPAVGEVLTASFVTGSPKLFISETDAQGRFEFEVNEYGLQELIIQPLRNRELNYIIDLDQSYSAVYGFQSGELVMSDNEAKVIAQCISNMQIEALYDGYAKPVTQKVNQIEDSPFYGEVNFSVSIEKFIDLPNLEEIIHEIIPMVVIRKEKGQKFIYLIDDGNKQIENNNNMILVDGVPFYNHEEILKLKPKDIDRIDVVSLNYFLKDQSIGRVLSIFTKDYDLDGMAFDEGIFRQEQNGYREEYEYVAPNYEADSLIYDRIPDYRNQLFWKSDLEFNAENKAKVSFFTTDENSQYQITVEGINHLGLPVRKTKMIRVN